MEPAMRKGRKKWEEGEEKERNPERGGGVGREAMMHGRSPATQPSAPSPPKPASLARPSGDAGLPGTAALGLTALPATPARRTQRPNAQSSPPEPSHPSPPLPGPRWPPTPAPTSPRAPITSLREKASERPSSTRLEARVPYHGSGAMTRSPSPLAWRPDFPGAPRDVLYLILPWVSGNSHYPSMEKSKSLLIFSGWC